MRLFIYPPSKTAYDNHSQRSKYLTELRSDLLPIAGRSSRTHYRQSRVIIRRELSLNIKDRWGIRDLIKKSRVILIPDREKGDTKGFHLSKLLLRLLFPIEAYYRLLRLVP